MEITLHGNDQCALYKTLHAWTNIYIYFVFQDVDECTNNNGGCEHLCSNTIGSFLCDCGAGYQLDGNGLNCNGKLCMFFPS